MAVVASILAMGSMEEGDAAVVLYEPFNYSGSSLHGQSGAFGISGSWTSTVGSITLSNDDISLQYPTNVNLFTEQGDRVHHTYSGPAGGTNRAVAGMATPINLNAGGTSYYISFLAQRSPGAGFRLTFENAADLTRWQMGVDPAGAPFVGMQFNTVGSAGSIAVNQTYFFIGRIQIGTAPTLDTVYLNWYGPNDYIPATEPTSWMLQRSENSGVILNRMSIRINGGTVQLDEIRIGTLWSDVNGYNVPEPSTFGLLLLSAAMLTRFRKRLWDVEPW